MGVREHCRHCLQYGAGILTGGKPNQHKNVGAAILTEIRNHISDATAAGTPIEEVLRALGPAEQLARGYRVELLLNPKVPTPRSDRWLKIVGLLVVGSLPTFIIVVTLSTIGVSLFVSGVAVFAAGIAQVLGVLPSRWTPDCAPWVSIVFGPAIAVLGGAALWGLVAYLKLLARIVRRVLPARQPV